MHTVSANHDSKDGRAAEDIVASDPDYSLWVLIRQTRDAIIKSRKNELRRYGISSIQAGVLFTIQAIGNEATPAEISRRLIREPHSISGLLSRMEKRGLVKKTKDLTRKNLVRVSLTKKGGNIFQKSGERKSFHKIMSVLSKEEHQQLMKSLEILRDKALKEAGVEHELPFPSSQPEQLVELE